MYHLGLAVSPGKTQCLLPDCKSSGWDIYGWGAQASISQHQRDGFWLKMVERTHLFSVKRRILCEQVSNQFEDVLVDEAKKEVVTAQNMSLQGPQGKC